MMKKLTAAEAYQEFLVPNVFEPWVQFVLGETKLEPGQAVLDVACGPWTATRLAAAAVGPDGRVIGVDLDEEMLAVGRRSPQAERAASIEWRQADAMNLP